MGELAPDTLERLVKLLGMLGSAHDGERAAAGLKAHELLKCSGSQGSDVIALALPAAEPHWRTMAKACCRLLDSLNVRAFVQSMAARAAPLSNSLGSPASTRVCRDDARCRDH
jgi:hypothetical protein